MHISNDAPDLSAILPVILPAVGVLVEFGFGSEVKFQNFCRLKRTAP